MSIILDPQIHLWFSILITGVVIYFFARDKYPIEITSLGLLAILLIWGSVFPLYSGGGDNLLRAKDLLAGFANPSLVAVLALIIMGHAVIQTQALMPLTKFVMRSSNRMARIMLIGLLLGIAIFSGILNNTPLVVIAIPIMQALADRMDRAPSRVLMPLSFAAILGGMTTIIGSSTNLLVSSAVEELGMDPIGFFDFVVPGMIMAGVGLVYVILILPNILPHLKFKPGDIFSFNQEFVAELNIDDDSDLIGERADEDGNFPSLENITVRLIKRGGTNILPPFTGYQIQPNDILVVTATRQTLIDFLSGHPGSFIANPSARNTENDGEGADQLAEIMITPGSRLIDLPISQIDMIRQYGVSIIGLKRRDRMMRQRLGDIRLQSGDVLLVIGPGQTIEQLSGGNNFFPVAGSKRILPAREKAPLAATIFFLTIGAAVTGLVKIPVAATIGAIVMIMTGCLNVRQAARAFDRQVFLLVGCVLALGHVLQVTEGATAIANALLSLPIADIPLVTASMLFLLIAIATNILSNNACAVLFTPIAISVAGQLGVDPYIFAYLVIFAANCCFASPIGYQTNLMVMGPGQYKFSDFIRAGIPLILILWVVYMGLAKFYYGL